jgi:hypothetical protein
MVKVLEPEPPAPPALVVGVPVEHPLKISAVAAQAAATVTIRGLVLIEFLVRC